ncbi:hypothetical protein AB7M29_003031 [Pseudomonas sp. F-14 TE3623]|jgi:hypothetical protein|uniref:universal stress protein n=1 Tax=Pseudomonas farris TaxID=2841207 RepID=UPI001CEC695E
MVKPIPHKSATPYSCNQLLSAGILASIILGSQGNGFLAGIFLGSVATKVIQLSSIPITLVK